MIRPDVLLDVLAQLRLRDELLRAALHRLAERERTIARQAARIGVLRGQLREGARPATRGAAFGLQLETRKFAEADKKAA